MATYSREDFERIAAAIGKDVADCRSPRMDGSGWAVPHHDFRDKSIFEALERRVLPDNWIGSSSDSLSPALSSSARRKSYRMR